MYILDLFDLNEIGYNMMSGIFSVVAHLYDLMLDLITKSNFQKLNIDFSSVLDSIYLLAGIFMLFRIVVSFLNYIVDPDKVSSSDVGAGKMITRVLVAVILLLLLRPGDSIVYKTLDRIQDALLEDNGLITNIVGNLNESNKLSINSENNKFITNVYAADTITCYYNTFSKDNNRPNGGTNYNNYGYFKAKISSKSFKGAIGNNNVYIKFYSGSENQINFTTIKNFTIDASNYTFSGTCPYISSDAGFERLTLSSEKKYYSSSLAAFIIWDPYKTLKEAHDSNSGQKNNAENSGGNTNNFDQENDDSIFAMPAIDASREAINFAAGSARSFVTCNNAEKKELEECNGLLEGMFLGKDEEIIDEIGKTVSFSFIPSVLVGIVEMVFLLILCVDVIVRTFKLFFLQMISPVAIISYIDPKDKKFNEWIKMYMATYADLFIKLLAIKLGSVFLNMLWRTNEITGLESIFWIFGILIFVKAVPGMISKLFGLDLAAGSFKDSMGMLKAGLGFGAGAVVGAGAGLAGAAVALGGAMKNKDANWKQKALAGARGLKGAVGSTFRGAGAGTKGMSGVVKNAKSSFADNWNRKQLYEDGLTEDILTGGAIAGGALSYASRVDRANQAKKDKVDNLDKFTKFKGSIEDTAESGKFMKTLRQKVATGALNLDENTLQDYRDTWVEYQIAMNDIKTSDSFMQRKTQLQAQVDAGNMSEAQMNNQLNSIVGYELNAQYNNLQTRADAISRETNVTFEVEAGKQSGILSTMEQANATLKNTGDVRGTAGTDQVSSFKDLKDANTKVKKESTRIHDEIFASTEADDKYRASKAAQEIAKNNKK